MGLAENQIDKLQRTQNMACRIICSVRKYDSISYHLKDLHWLCIHEHIAYNICIVMFKCYRDIAHKYLTELVRFDSNHNRNLHSNLKFLAQVPRSNNVQTSMSACVFSITGLVFVERDKLSTGYYWLHQVLKKILIRCIRKCLST